MNQKPIKSLIITVQLPTNQKSKPYSFSTSSLWDIVSAAKISSGYQVLLQGTAAKLGSYQVWSVDTKGKISKQSDGNLLPNLLPTSGSRDLILISTIMVLLTVNFLSLDQNPIAAGPSRVFSSNGGKPYTLSQVRFGTR